MVLSLRIWSKSKSLGLAGSGVLKDYTPGANCPHIVKIVLPGLDENIKIS